MGQVAGAGSKVGKGGVESGIVRVGSGCVMLRVRWLQL